jgi:type I restriction enzyme R subunit
MVENLSIEDEDFDLVPVFTRDGGLAAARRAFKGELESILRELNEAIAA